MKKERNLKLNILVRFPGYAFVCKKPQANKELHNRNLNKTFIP